MHGTAPTNRAAVSPPGGAHPAQSSRSLTSPGRGRSGTMPKIVKSLGKGGPRLLAWRPCTLLASLVGCAFARGSRVIASVFCKNTVCNASHRWVSRYQVWVHHMPPYRHHSLFYDGSLDASLCITRLRCRFRKCRRREELPWGPAGHGAIATVSITKCKEFWRTFVHSPVVMN